MSFGKPFPRCPEFGSTYNIGCRCSFCRTEQGRRVNDYRRRKKLNEEDSLIDATELREALQAAMDRGMSYKMLSDLTGSDDKFFARIMEGSCQVHRSTASRVMASLDDFDITRLDRNTGVPNKLTRQLIYSLNAQGFSVDHLQEIFQKNRGINGGFVHTATRNQKRVRAENQEHMKWLASVIGTATGPSEESIRRARRNARFPLKHYDMNGDIIASSLSPEQRQLLRRVQ